ncbi:MAG: hypothetical protein ACSHX0_12505 [Akkermansiaceae bacterium]
MNEREKKLIILLFGAAFLILNVFLYLSYDSAMLLNKAALKRNNTEIERMRTALITAESQQEDIEWLNANPPAEGIHGQIGASLATLTEKSALRYGITIKKRPSPINEDLEEQGTYRTARVSVKGNAMDKNLYQWLVDLQSPNDHRSITFLHIEPQRDDPTRIDCEVEITQWFIPAEENSLSAN